MIGVYIARAENGDVLYIGSAGDIDKRLTQHHGKTWWPLVADVERRPTATRALAFAAERDLIHTLAPTYNQRGKGGAQSVSRNLVGPVIKPRPEVLAVLIESHGTVAKLAAAVGIDHMTMSNIWRGVTIPSSKVIARLMVVGALSFDDLFVIEVLGDPEADWLIKRERKSA